MSTRVRLVIAGCLAAGLVAVTAIVVVPRLLADDTPAPPRNAPAAATLTLPYGRATSGEPVAVVAHVISGAPLASLELWHGGSLVDRRELTGTRRVIDRLQFTPAKAGRHLLLLRVVDTEGRVTHAAPLHIRVAEPATVAVNVPASSGRRVARLGVMGPRADRLPTDRRARGPEVSATIEDCHARLNVAADATSPHLAVFGLTPAQPGFQLLGKPAADGSPIALTLPLSGGEQAFYAQPYGPSGAGTPSAIVAVQTPEECLTKRWTGDVSIVDGRLHSPGKPGLAYLYLSVDNGPYQRVPADGQTFVRRDAAGELDFGTALPPLDAAKRIDVEAWTRADGRATRLGAGSLQVQSDDEVMPALVGLLPGTTLDHVVLKAAPVDDKGYEEILLHHGEIHAYTIEGPDNMPPGQNVGVDLPQLTKPYQFRWQPKLPQITHGVWQVSMVPPLKTPNLSQPGLLAFGTVPAGQSDFDIDFRPLVLPGFIPPNKAPDLQYDSAVPGYAVAQPVGVPGAGGQKPKGPGAGGDTVVAIGPPGFNPALLVQLLRPSMLYVRIVPMAGEQPVDAVSNAVTFALFLSNPTPKSNLLPTPPALKLTVDFDRPYLPDLDYNRCVRVIDNPNPFNTNPPYQVSSAYGYVHEGETICPTYPTDDDDFDLGDVFNAAIDLLDEVVGAFEYLKEQAIGVIVTASGCDAILASSTCHTLASIAVDAALVSVGIPPELPNSSQLLGLAKGELVDSVYAIAEGYGVSCDVAAEECKQLMNKLLDEVVKEGQKAISAATVANIQSGGGALFLNSKIVVVPEPRGKLQPAVFRVTYTRTPAPAQNLPTACSIQAWVAGNIAQAQWYDYDAKKQATGPVSGNIFAGSNATPVNLAALKNGESVTRVVVLRVPTVWFEPGADPYVGMNDGIPGYASVHSDPSHYDVLMRAPSILTAGIQGCASKIVDIWAATVNGSQP